MFAVTRIRVLMLSEGNLTFVEVVAAYAAFTARLAGVLRTVKGLMSRTATAACAAE